MNLKKRVLPSVALLLMVCSARSPADQEAAADVPLPLTAGFKDHFEPSSAGSVDWTNGFIFAEGIGKAEGTDKQNELLAVRAATVVAERNALAVAQGIRIHDSAVVGDEPNRVIHLKGIIKGHEVVETDWQPGAHPPTARVRIRVPMWGVRSLATLYTQSERTRIQRTGFRRWDITARQADVSDLVIVFDARGLEVNTCMFPAITGPHGRRLYDLNTPIAADAQKGPTVRYVETRLDAETLSAQLNAGVPHRLIFAAHQPGEERNARQAPGEAPASQPTTQPARRRTRRRMVIQVADTGGENRTRLTLTEEDVNKLRQSPEGASALRNAQVLVVVDSAAAGTEGRLFTLPERLLAAIPSGTCPDPMRIPSLTCWTNPR